MISPSAVAEYIKTGRMLKALKILLGKNKPIINFDIEHANRPPRFIAVVNDYKANLPVEQIATKYGCTRGTVQRYARMAGLPIRARGFDIEIKNKVIAMYKLNKPIAEIQAKLGVSQAYISKIATEEGISRYKKKA